MTASSRIKRTIIERIVTSGIPPSSRLEGLNTLLAFGKWLKKNRCDIVFDSRYDLYRYVNNDIAGGQPIDYLEFGVYHGDSIRFWTELNGEPDSRFFGFDSFEGIPERWGPKPKGSYSTHGKVPDIDDRRVQWVEGYFQKSLPGFMESFRPANRLILHLDADLYSSTLYALSRLEPAMAPGTILIFDEFSSVTHEFRAFKDFAEASMKSYRLRAVCNPFFEQAAIEITF